MNTLLLSEVFPPKAGGSGRWFREIYGRLPRDRYLIAAGEDARSVEYDRAQELRVARLPLSLPEWRLRRVGGLRSYSRAILGLRRLAKAEGIAMVHCGRCLPEGILARGLKLLTGIPYACYVHGAILGPAADDRELTWLARRVLRDADFAIANSRSTASRLEQEWGLPADRIRLLYPGVDTRRFVPAVRDLAARRRLGWGDRPVVLTVGRLRKSKGHDRMIRALRAVRLAIPDVLYVIVGAGEELGALQHLADEEGHAGHVQFLGELGDQNLIRCYQQCDLFAMPNRQVGRDVEGFGMALLEAQACGKPVVAGDSGGMAETLRVPETGRLVPCEGQDKIGATVVALLSKPERLSRMGEAARRWAVENFDWSALARQAAEMFGEDPASQPLRRPADLALR